MGSLYWLHNKDTVVLLVDRMNLCDYAFVDNVFLDNRNKISTRKVSLPEFEQEKTKQILNKKTTSEWMDGEVQFEAVEELDGITGEAGQFMKGSDIIDSAWDSTELCQAVLVSDKFKIGHWNGFAQ